MSAQFESMVAMAPTPGMRLDMRRQEAVAAAEAEMRDAHAKALAAAQARRAEGRRW